MPASLSAPPRPPPPAVQPVRSVVSPLLPVLLPIVLAAVVLGAVFAWLFPPDITARAPAARFTDITAASGVRFVHQQGGADAPTTLGGGVTVLDYNGDGRPDLFFVNGAPWPWEESFGKRIGRSSALYRNDGDGRFSDVTAAAGLNTEMQGMAAVAGDYDGDGLPDLFVTGVGRNRLFRNIGAGRFEDVTETAGIGGNENTWSTGAAWLDVDADGQLDLIVLHYARWPLEIGLGQAFAVAEMGRSYGAPTGFTSTAPTVWHNRGDGRFAADSGSGGLRDLDPETGRPVAWPLALTPVDANGDDRPDLLITYQQHGAVLFLAGEAGAYVRQTTAQAPRQEGAAASLASASALPFAPRHSEGERLQALLATTVPTTGTGPVSLATKLGVVTLDLDLDGTLELFSGEGRAESGPNQFGSGRAFAAAPQLFWRHDQTWQPLLGTDPDRPALPALLVRGVAVADLDGDGDDDLVIAQNNGPALLLRNDGRTGSPWLRLQLTATRTEPGAAGARVEVHTPRRVLTQSVLPRLGYLAQSESALTFGLGEDARVRKIVIRWPSGQVQEVRPEGLNRTLAIREP